MTLRARDTVQPIGAGGHRIAKYDDDDRLPVGKTGGQKSGAYLVAAHVQIHSVIELDEINGPCSVVSTASLVTELQWRGLTSSLLLNTHRMNVCICPLVGLPFFGQSDLAEDLLRQRRR